MTYLNESEFVFLFLVNISCGYFFRRDKLYIVMEYCGGGSLQDIYHCKKSLKLILTRIISLKIISEIESDCLVLLCFQ